MSNRRYFEIDSTYRNRKQYPNPSNFTVLIAQSGTRDAIHAYDPVSLAAPQKRWVPNELILSLGTVDTPVNAPLNTSGEFVICIPIANNAARDPGYYVGAPIQIVTPVGETVQITSWNYLSSNATDDCFTVNVTPKFSQIPTGNVSFLPNTTDLAIGSVFIPDGFVADHYYVGCILYNETQTDWRPIISYDGTTKLVGLNLSPQFGGPVNLDPLIWSLEDTFTIRKAPPRFTGVFPNPAPLVFPPSLNQQTSFYISANTHVNVGDFIRFTSGAHVDTNCRVTKYIAVGTVVIDHTVDPPTLNTLPLVTTDCILNSVPANGDMFEVLQFTRDNAVPFCYSGSLVSQQEMVCYEIELINLVLPNKTLTSGGRTAFYPYVYVELQNVSGASAGTKCVIYSNNPNSTRMLFRAAIDDIPNPVVSPFVKIDGDGMVQTVKFKPNDNFKFGVYLPNGEPLQTVEFDNLSPDSPDPLLQVSAMFSLKRL